jgi:hypothetical protein
MSDRNPSPDPHPLVTRLTREGTDETEDVVALVGFVGTTPSGCVRLYSPESQLQRYLDLPADQIVDSRPVDPDDELSPTLVWVRRATMVEPMFTPDALTALEAEFTGCGMSTWPLVPDTRLVAASLLDLLVDLLPGWEETDYQGGA